MVGGIEDGHGEFYDQEDFKRRKILVRVSFVNISVNEARSEQAFSDYGGKTWETNWINRYIRLADDAE